MVDIQKKNANFFLLVPVLNKKKLNCHHGVFSVNHLAYVSFASGFEKKFDEMGKYSW